MTVPASRDRIYLSDMTDASARIMSYTRGMTQDDFIENRLVLDAVVRNFEIMGEAAKRVSDELRVDAPQVPWRLIAGFRDVQIHGYKP